MESLQLDMELRMEMITSSLKTHGEHHGEIKGMSKLEPTMFVVFYYNHLTQLRLPQWNDFDDNEQSKNFVFLSI
jgi:hypothetical protein